jgi:long-chain acyl-CoA synthetase
MVKENLVQNIEESIRKNWNYPAFSDYDGESVNFSEVAERIRWFHMIFEKGRIKKGDKIALLGKNSKNWAIGFIATVTYGAVVVPILPDFPASDIYHIVNHSDSVFLMVSQSLYENLDEKKMPDLEAIFSLEDFGLLSYQKKSMAKIHETAESEVREKYKGRLGANEFSLPRVDNAEAFSINYTSGTSGFSKGVMLPHNSLIANIDFARRYIPLKAQDNIVSFLPLAHAYGLAFEFLFPFAVGCHITFLGKIPSPRIILEAFRKVRPRLILAVPLIIEKIYKKQIKPTLDKGAVKLLRKLPPVDKAIGKKVCKKLVDAFGGNFIEIVIGGAALNKEVEEFLTKVNFPFTVGYGMTECGPLISYSPWKQTRIFSVGRPVDTLDVKIDSPDPRKVAGEILVRGEHVMNGYYKNEEATKGAIDKDGWLHTGDLGLIDGDNFVFIKGRCKDMMLGPSGQNIYPEEIESKINNLPYVQESLVVEKEKKLFALIYPDFESVDAGGVTEAQLQEILEKNRDIVNKELPAFSKIAKFEIYPEEFEKTPTKKIKRYLYTMPLSD